jgi:hypothetical protein
VRKLVTAMMMMGLATAAFAQAGPNVNMFGEGKKLKTDVEIKAEQDRENNFKAGISKIPDAKVKADPWGGVRSTGTVQPNQAQAKPNAK